MAETTKELASQQNVEAILKELLSEIRENKPSDLWSVQNIADYIKKSKKTIQNRVLCDDTFPRPVVITGGKLWVAKEVREWILRHRH